MLYDRIVALLPKLEETLTVEPVESLCGLNMLDMVGLPGFEPESIEPKSTSLDQASRQPL